MQVSLIICTYNRCEDLRLTLQQLSQSGLPENFLWELLVMDNNSADDTKSVCSSFADKLPLRYIFEPRQGKSFALNRAVAEARAPLLLLTDDDVSVTPDWIARLTDAAWRHPECVYFGGRVLSQWQGQPPRWFVENHQWLKVNPQIDFGPTEKEVAEVKHMCFLGANFAIRKSVFSPEFRYSEEFGPSGSFFGRRSRHGGEETELQFRMGDRQIKGLYVPDAVVYHRDPLYRMTEKYLRWYHQARGRENILNGDYILTPGHLFGAPRYLWRTFLSSSFQYLLTRWTRPPRVWLQAEIVAAAAWGEIMELRARGVYRKNSDSPQASGSKK